jgi:hypothetical protein
MKLVLSLVALAACALALAAEALAAPPVLQSVGHTNRHPTATWTLPPGVEAAALEIATRPETDSDGTSRTSQRADYRARVGIEALPIVWPVEGFAPIPSASLKAAS